MKSIALASALLAVLAAAVPLNKRQDQAFSTTTQVVIDTVWSTTTLWVPSSSAAPAYNNNNNNNDGFVTMPSQTPSSSAAPPPPPPSTTSSTSVAPVVTSADPPTPTTTWAPPPATTTTAAPYVAPAAASPTPAAPASNSGSSYGSAQGQYNGDATYYDLSVGLGSCGWQGSNSQNLVAVAADIMQNGANPNANPLCGKTINIYYGGAVHQAEIYDTCPTCAGGSLDLSPTLFQIVAPEGDGRVHGVSWSIV